MKYHVYPNYSDRQAYANSVDPDQTPQNAATEQGLHCLPLNKEITTHQYIVKMHLFKI